MAIGDWRRGRIIGRGSTGTVSIANDVISGEVFAVKSAELDFSSMLQREQRILSALSSPYIINYLGFDISSESSATSRLIHNLFLEYAPEGSLSDEIKKLGRLDEARIRSFACDIVRGLVYLHSVGVVHCDIKPSNILVCSKGHGKIGDFGCARWLEEDLQLSGTPMFMAPEVARGDEQGTEADVWALGCTILEMVTGGSPWSDVSDPFAAIHQIAFSDHVPNLPDNLSDEGKDFLEKCLRRDPRQRWTAKQLMQHSFVSKQSLERTELKYEIVSHNLGSPISVLDQEMFDDSDYEELTEQLQLDDRFKMLEQICSPSGPEWTWDESWINVRGEIQCVSVAEAAVTSISATRNEVTTDDSDNTIASDLFFRNTTVNSVIDTSNINLIIEFDSNISNRCNCSSVKEFFACNQVNCSAF